MLELQKFESPDFDRLISWIPDERFLGQWAGRLFIWPLDKTQLAKYLEETEGAKPKRYAFKAICISDKKVVGHIEVDLVDYEKSIGTLSRVLIGDPEDRGKGYGTEMIKLAIDFAFNKISLSRIELAVFDFNGPAISCYEKLGFKKHAFRVVEFGSESWNSISMRLAREDHAKNS